MQNEDFWAAKFPTLFRPLFFRETSISLIDNWTTRIATTTYPNRQKNRYHRLLSTCAHAIRPKKTHPPRSISTKSQLAEKKRRVTENLYLGDHRDRVARHRRRETVQKPGMYNKFVGVTHCTREWVARVVVLIPYMYKMVCGIQLVKNTGWWFGGCRWPEPPGRFSNTAANARNNTKPTPRPARTSHPSTHPGFSLPSLRLSLAFSLSLYLSLVAEK